MDLTNYINLHKQFILLITGLNGCNKNQIINKLSLELNIQIISYKSFIIDNQKPENLMIFDNIIDWDKFNNEINKNKDKGIIIESPIFPSNKVKFICDYHIHYYMNKQKIKDIINNYNNNLTDNDSLVDIKIVNQKIIPYYMDIIKKMYINKSIDISNITIEEQYEKTLNTIKSFLLENSTSNKQNKNLPIDKFIEKIDEFIGLSDNYDYKLSIDDLISKTKFYEYSYEDANGQNKGLITFKYKE